MLRWIASLSLVLGCLTADVARGDADVVTAWNGVMLKAVQETRMPPPPATRAFAMVHLAIFDAVNGIEQGYEPYLVDFRQIPPPAGASAEAAAAVAAHTVLVTLFPQEQRRFDVQLRRCLRRVHPVSAREAGAEWGLLCGEAMLAARDDDGATAVVPYTPSEEPGHWRPTPADFGEALFPQWPFLVPFAIEQGDQFRAPPPPELASEEYAIAFLEVKELGAVDSELRTEDQTRIAFFWEDGPGSVTPPGRWQLIAQELVERFDLSLLETARLFALLSMTQADAAIVSWDSKYAYDHWRPVTAIPLADEDGNDLTDADPEWEPLLPTPPFPAYTSGHSTFSGSSAEMLELYFDDRNLAIDVRVPRPYIWPKQLTGKVRSYRSLREAAEEAGQSRIYGGIHWPHDNIEGLESGRALAEYVFSTALPPLAP